jgi:hypothetical protein
MRHGIHRLPEYAQWIFHAGTVRFFEWRFNENTVDFTDFLPKPCWSDQQIAEKFLIIYGGVLIHDMVIFVFTPHVMLLTQTTGGRDS